MNRRLLVTLALLVLLALPSLGSAGPFGRRSYYSTCYSPSYSYYQPYYAPSYYQTYTPTYAPYVAPVAAPVPTVEAKSWRTAVVDYAASLKEIEAFNQAMNTIVPGYAAAHSTYYGGQGQTLYGVSPAYSVKSAVVTENVGVNLELADQRSARLLDGTKEAFSSGMSQRQEFLAQSSQDSARTREINAKGNAAALVLQQAATLLQSAEAAPSQKTTTTYSGTGNAPVAVAQPNIVADPDMQTFLKTVAVPACASCHSGPNAKSKMDINQYASFNAAQKAAILERLLTDDPAKHMPRLPDGKPGKLSGEAIRAFATH